MAVFCTYCGNQVTETTKFCTNCGIEIGQGHQNTPKNKQNLSSKRQRVLAKNKTQSGNKKMLYFIIAIFGVMGFVAFFNSLPSLANPIIEKQPVITAEFKYPPTSQIMNVAKAQVKAGKIVIPLNELKRKKFLRFNYASKGLNTPLLAYISEEGKVITAVSMCEPCNSTAFHIRGDQLVCNSCGTIWELDNLSGISGSCQKYPPDALPSVVVGNEIQIDESIVAKWQRRI